MHGGRLHSCHPACSLCKLWTLSKKPLSLLQRQGRRGLLAVAYDRMLCKMQSGASRCWRQSPKPQLAAAAKVHPRRRPGNLLQMLVHAAPLAVSVYTQCFAIMCFNAIVIDATKHSQASQTRDGKIPMGPQSAERQSQSFPCLPPQRTAWAARGMRWSQPADIVCREQFCQQDLAQTRNERVNGYVRWWQGQNSGRR